MNQILLFPEDIEGSGKAILTGRRLDHLREILGKDEGSSVRAGVFNGMRGTAIVTAIDDQHAELSLSCTAPPPPKIPLTLVLAMQRPKVMKRILQSATAVGAQSIHIIRTWRVEKSYFFNQMLSPDGLHHEVALGLEQSLDTIPPDIQTHTLFRPFVEDELPAIIKGSTALVAHPYAGNECPRSVPGPVTLALGPEGGFIQFEIELLQAQGFCAVTLGERVLRSEHALPFLIGRILGDFT
jgi:RsmE family RNA methyltransferase